MSEIVYPVSPNQTPFQSNLAGDMPMQQVYGFGPTAVGDVYEETALGSSVGGTDFTPQGPVNDLASLRQKFPFLQIIPIPTESAVAICSRQTLDTDTGGNNSNPYFVGEMVIPDGAVLARIQANDEIYCSRHGSAQVPNTINTPANGTGTCKSFQVPNSDGALYYVGGIKSLSFASPTANTVVTAMCYAPDQYPR